MTQSLPALPTSIDELNQIPSGTWQALLSGEPVEAARWMTTAARLGHAEAQVVLGQWTLDGRGVAVDAAHALHWFLLAAQQNHPMGMNMAGRCHEQGWGTAVDAGKAAHWYRLAAQTGLPEARYNLANLLASGNGVAVDQQQALALYRQAFDQGYAKAGAKLGRYFEDGQLVPKDAAMAFACYRFGAEGGDFRGQFCYAGMLAARGRLDEALGWLAKVPETATPRYLRQAGALLLESPHPDFRAIGESMQRRADAVLD